MNRSAAGASERNIQSAIIDRLRWHGWMVRELSQPRAVSGSMVGMPDVIAFRHGHTLLIECKSKKGKLRASQHIFRAEILTHESSTLRYVVMNDVDAFARWLQAMQDSDEL